MCVKHTCFTDIRERENVQSGHGLELTIMVAEQSNGNVGKHVDGVRPILTFFSEDQLLFQYSFVISCEIQ